MQTKEFLKIKKTILSELEVHKKRINTRYAKVVKEYLKHNSPAKVGKVYDTVFGRKKVRVVVYDIDIRIIDSKRGHVFIQAGVWILNEESIPTKWKSWVIAGVSNPQVLTLSKDQTNHNVPVKIF